MIYRYNRFQVDALGVKVEDPCPQPCSRCTIPAKVLALNPRVENPYLNPTHGKILDVQEVETILLNHYHESPYHHYLLLPSVEFLIFIWLGKSAGCIDMLKKWKQVASIRFVRLMAVVTGTRVQTRTLLVDRWIVDEPMALTF